MRTSWESCVINLVLWKSRRRVQTRRNRYLAIAAAVAMAVLALGLWLSIQRQSPTNVIVSKPEQSMKESSEAGAQNPIDEKKLSTLSASNKPAAIELNKDSAAAPLWCSKHQATASHSFNSSDDGGRSCRSSISQRPSDAGLKSSELKVKLRTKENAGLRPRKSGS